MRTESSFMWLIWSIVGGCTLSKMSALSKTSASSRAPFAAYPSSKKPANSPAPDCTATSKPASVSLGTSSGTSATRCSPGTVSFGTLTSMGIDIVRILLARYSNPAHESCDSPIRKEGREFLHAFCPLAWRTVRHPKPLFNTPPTRKVTRQTLGKTKHSTSHRFPYQETLWGPHFYTCLRWVRLPLEEVRDAPE